MERYKIKPYQQDAVDRMQNGCSLWLCECDCGNTTIVVYSNLKSGHTKSCGCLYREKAIETKYRRNRYILGNDVCVGFDINDKCFIFDKSDYKNIYNYCWYINRQGYVIGLNENGERVRMHRLLLGITDLKVQVDHINNIRHDNRRSNLRTCNNAQNNMNRPPQSNNTSGKTGVVWEQRRQKWTSRIKTGGKEKFLGYFDCKEDAIKRRIEAEKEYFGEFRFDEKNANNIVDVDSVKERFPRFKIRDYQEQALEKMHNGCVLKGGVGTGKSFTSILYYWTKVCGGVYSEKEYKPMCNPRPLYIITTARKRDSNEWLNDLASFLLSDNPETNPYYDKAPVIIDSYNNIKKYTNVIGAFFIFDEQKLSGKGVWVKSFYKIAKKNRWIMLSASPGEKWEHLAPLFIANLYYKNITDFRNQHIEYNQFTSYPSIKAYHNVGKLIKLRNEMIVVMKGTKKTTQIHKDIICDYNKEYEKLILRKRWNPYEDRPIQNAAEMSLLLKRLVFGDRSRLDEVWDLHSFKHPKIIIFYDYNFELDALIEMCEASGFEYAQWNGHKHEPVPDGNRWLYLCQYTSAAEAWQTTSCSTMIFFNNNFSYSVMTQAAGRIDRLNTPFKELYYYHLTSNSFIDKRIKSSLKQKKDFNEMREFRRYFKEDIL